jgi:hypothetical protein
MTEVALCEHVVEVRLRGTQRAMDEFADVPASPRFRIAADVDADHVLDPRRMIWPVFRTIFPPKT